MSTETPPENMCVEKAPEGSKGKGKGKEEANDKKGKAREKEEKEEISIDDKRNEHVRFIYNQLIDSGRDAEISRQSLSHRHVPILNVEQVERDRYECPDNELPGEAGGLAESEESRLGKFSGENGGKVASANAVGRRTSG